MVHPFTFHKNVDIKLVRMTRVWNNRHQVLSCQLYSCPISLLFIYEFLTIVTRRVPLAEQEPFSPYA